MSEQEGKVAWGNPAACVLFATGTIAFPLGLFMAGVIPAACGPIAAVWLIALAVVDTTGGIILYKRGETALGTIGLFFGGVLCLGGGFSTLVHVGLPLGGMTQAIPMNYEGWTWIAIGAFLLGVLPASAKFPWSVFLFLLVIGIGLGLFGIGLLTGMVSLIKTGGWLVVAFSVWCYYAGIAFLTNETYQRGVVPLGRPFAK
jgi:hypothetical protein